jgi:hypothetical protein
MQAPEILSIGVQATSRHRPYFVSRVESWLHFLKSLRPARWGPSPPLHKAGSDRNRFLRPATPRERTSIRAVKCSFPMVYRGFSLHGPRTSPAARKKRKAPGRFKAPPSAIRSMKEGAGAPFSETVREPGEARDHAHRYRPHRRRRRTRRVAQWLNAGKRLCSSCPGRRRSAVRAGPQHRHWGPTATASDEPLRPDPYPPSLRCRPCSRWVKSPPS